jgi:hypothetical protein
MKRVDTIARVRRAFHIQGWSMKKIARELHVSRIEAIAPLVQAMAEACARSCGRTRRTSVTSASDSRCRGSGRGRVSWSSSCRPMRASRHGNG